MTDTRARAAAEAQRAELANVIEVAAIALDTKGHPAGTYWEGFAELVGRYVDKLVADAVAEALTERDRHWIDRTVSTDVYSEATRKWTETIRERDQLAEEIARLKDGLSEVCTRHGCVYELPDIHEQCEEDKRQQAEEIARLRGRIRVLDPCVVFPRGK